MSGDANGQGHATAAVAQISRLAFRELGLYRIEAGTLRRNARSQRVLEHNGFERIGVACAYLKIAGRWQDHVLYQLLDPTADPADPSPRFRSGPRSRALAAAKTSR